MAIELAVIDLDGTLIRSDLSVGERTLAALREAKNRGVKITIATGRMIAASFDYAEQIGVQVPMIALNGALVQSHNNGNPLAHCPILKKSFAQILPVIADTKAAATVVLGDESFGWNIDDFTRKRLAAWIVNIKDIAPEDSPCEPTIVMVAGYEEPVRETTERLKALDVADVQFFLFPSMRYYPMWYLEIRGAGIDKGSGVKMLREKLGIPKERILVIGDYLNDLPMFAEAGIKAVVANAHIDAIEAADYVSPLSNDRDGVGEIVEKFILEG